MKHMIRSHGLCSGYAATKSKEPKTEKKSMSKATWSWRVKEYLKKEATDFQSTILQAKQEW